jgi:hypothetical protein
MVIIMNIFTFREDGDGPLKCLWAHDKFNLTILDTEFSLALGDLPSLVQKVKDIKSKVPAVFPTQGILMRFTKASTTLMSHAYGRDTVHFEYYVSNRKRLHDEPSAGLAAYQAINQVVARDFGGSAHWGKSGFAYHTKEIFDRNLDPVAKTKFVGKSQLYLRKS